MAKCNEIYFCTISLIVALSAIPSIAATKWLSYQDNLKPQVSNSLNKARLSSAIKISKPSENLPKDISFFSGIWAGAICHGFSDVKIAVTELTVDGAAITYSLGNYTGSFNNQEYKADILDGELAGETKTGFTIILGKRTKDENLNIKWVRGDDKEQSAPTTPKICYGVLKRLAVDARGTENPVAYDAYLRGVGLLAQRKYMDTEGNAAAQAAFTEAILLDPGYAEAYAGLSWAKWLHAASINNFASKDEAFDLAEKSLALNDNALARRTLAKKYFAPLGVYITANKSADLAVAELETAKRLQPNDPDVLADLAMALSFAGRPSDALGLIQKAMELNPSHPDWYFAASGIAYLLTDETEPAIRDLQRWSDGVPSWNVPYLFLVSAYGLAGRTDAAKTALDRHRHLIRGIKKSVYAMKRQWPMAPTEEEIFFRGLKIAGALE